MRGPVAIETLTIPGTHEQHWPDPSPRFRREVETGGSARRLGHIPELVRLTFEGELTVEPHGDAYVMALPSIVASLGGERARIPILGRVLGHEYRSSTRPLGDGRHGIRVYKAVRDQHGLTAGTASTPNKIATENLMASCLPAD